MDGGLVLLVIILLEVLLIFLILIDIVADESTSIFHIEKGGKLSLLKKYAMYDPNRTDGLKEIMERQARGKSEE